MSLEFAPLPNLESDETPSLPARSQSDVIAAPAFQILDGGKPRHWKAAPADSPADLSALQAKALRSLDLFREVFLDFLHALDDGQRRDRSVSTAQDDLSPLNPKAAAFANLFASAHELIAAFSEQVTGNIEPQTKAHGKIGDSDLKARLDQLTARQQCVFQLMVEGLPNKVIAYKLGIAETTVKAHVGVILQKLGVYSRSRAIALFNKSNSEARAQSLRLAESGPKRLDAPPPCSSEWQTMAARGPRISPPSLSD